MHIPLNLFAKTLTNSKQHYHHVFLLMKHMLHMLIHMLHTAIDVHQLQIKTKKKHRFSQIVFQRLTWLEHNKSIKFTLQQNNDVLS